MTILIKAVGRYFPVVLLVLKKKEIYLLNVYVTVSSNVVLSDYF